MVTAHGAKGSEYAHVFVIGCTQNTWDDTNNSGKFAYKLPDNLVSVSRNATDLEESRRLFYVAITRAKTHLQVSYAVKDDKDKEHTKSTFITELMEESNLSITPKAVPDELLADYLLRQFKETARPEIELVEDQYIDQLLKKYTLSVTHLNNFLDCPLKFYYQNLIRVPAAKNESMAFGSAVHWAIERLFVKMRANNNVFPAKQELVDDFNWHMKTTKRRLQQRHSN